MPFGSVFGSIFTTEAVIAAVVFGLVTAAMAVAVLVSRDKHRRGLPAAVREHLHAVEATFGVAVAAMAVFLLYSSFSDNSQDFPHTPVKPAVRVQVTAFQWCWRFHYAGEPVTVSGSCDNGQYPVLEVPAGEPVEYDISSVDVVHAFWVPIMRTKMDAFPGHVNSFTTTMTQMGRWNARCAQFCGLYHSEMDFTLQVVTPSQFRQWLHSQAALSGSTTANAGTGAAA